MSEDTDVFVMGLAVENQIGIHLFQRFGVKGHARVYDLKKIAAAMGKTLCKALPALHAFTGCDTVSAFAGKGKVSALKLVMGNQDLQDVFSELGQNWQVSGEMKSKVEAFTSRWYAPKSSAKQINDLRYHLFCAKRGEIESHQLPPCRDCLHKHPERANYQTAIWKRCLDSEPDVPTPVGKGWLLGDEDSLAVDWMEGSPEPEAVIDLLSCNSSKKCSAQRCP